MNVLISGKKANDFSAIDNFIGCQSKAALTNDTEIIFSTAKVNIFTRRQISVMDIFQVNFVLFYTTSYHTIYRSLCGKCSNFDTYDSTNYILYFIA